MRASHILAVLVLALPLLACPPPAPDLLVIPYCQQPAADCPGVPDGMDINDISSQVWCCDKIGGGCVTAELLTDCDALNQYAYYCEFGQSIPATFPNGTSGFECLGDVFPGQVEP